MVCEKPGAKVGLRPYGVRRWAKRALTFALPGVMLVLLTLLLVASPRTAAALSDGKNGALEENLVGTETAAPPATMTVAPTPTVPRWESVTLSELADELDWPPIVTEDGGKLSISLTLTTTEQAVISITPFDFSAG